jgi:hypothetical protein
VKRFPGIHELREITFATIYMHGSTEATHGLPHWSLMVPWSLLISMFSIGSRLIATSVTHGRYADGCDRCMQVR